MNNAVALILSMANLGGGVPMPYAGSRPLSERDKAQRSPELVAQLKEKAQAKRERRAKKRSSEQVRT